LQPTADQEVKRVTWITLPKKNFPAGQVHRFPAHVRTNKFEGFFVEFA
jgi:hypothetical protein